MLWSRGKRTAASIFVFTDLFLRRMTVVSGATSFLYLNVLLCKKKIVVRFCAVTKWNYKNMALGIVCMFNLSVYSFLQTIVFVYNITFLVTILCGLLKRRKYSVTSFSINSTTFLTARFRQVAENHSCFLWGHSLSRDSCMTHWVCIMLWNLRDYVYHVERLC